MEKQNKPAEQILLKHKEHQNVSEFADLLEKIALKLREEGQFTFIQGEEQVVIKPSQQIKTKYEYKVKGDKHSFEIEFDWYTGEQAPKKMGID